MSSEKARFTFPSKVAPLLVGPSGDPLPYWKYIFLRGGRGGGKTRSAISYIVVLMREKKIRGLVGREFLNSIKSSSWQSFKDEIIRQKLDNEFLITDREIKHKNGNFLVFTGLRHNVESIKSKEGFNLFFCDEARTLSQYSIDVVVPTIARNQEPRFIFVYNPEDENDPVHVLANSKIPDSITLDLSLDDNPFASEDLFVERARCYAEDPEKAAWIWGGQCIHRTDAQVFGKRYSISDFNLSGDENGPYIGLDFGFSADPTHAVAAYIKDDVIFVRHEVYGVGIEIDHLPDLLRQIPGATENIIRCDSARPETISYLRRHGFPKITAAKKWPGSVEDGISLLRTHKIMIHPSCRNLAEQARLYKYKVDPLTGDIKNELEDKHNHGFDALRYALEPMIRGKENPKKTSEINFDFATGTMF